MSIRIFLDDERSPKVEKFTHICRSYGEFVFVLSEIDCHSLSYISFDHDLGEDPLTKVPLLSGYDCAKALIDFDMDFHLLADDFTFNVHSANSVGGANIEKLLNNYLSHYKKAVKFS